MKDQRTLDQYYTRGEILDKEQRARRKYKIWVEKYILHPGFFSNKNSVEEQCQNK